MLIEQLDKNKIKVTVDASEQEKFGVTYESMTYSDCNTRKLCESIMEKAKKEIGFNVNGAKLLVEARKSSDGAVTLFLSKIKEEEKNELFGQTVVFDTFDDICDCCRAVNICDKNILTANTYTMSGKYYLYFEILCKRKEAAGVLKSFLEYGNKTKISDRSLKEHGKSIRLLNLNTDIQV